MANPSPFVPPLPMARFIPSPLPEQPVITELPIEPATNLGWCGKPQHPRAFHFHPSSPGPLQQPVRVIPESPIERAANFGWDDRPRHPGVFPIYHSSSIHGPGYQPPTFTPATPNADSSRLLPTSTTEFVGYQGGVPSGMHMDASSWSATRQPTPGFSMPRQLFLPVPGYQMPYTPHNGAWPSDAYGQYHGGTLPVWGMHVTALAGAALPITPNYLMPYTPHNGAWPPGWSMPVTAQAGVAPPTTPMPAGYGFIDFVPAWNVPPPGPVWATQPGDTRQNEVQRPVTRGGSGYGPALDHFEVQIIQPVRSTNNPLLEPIADVAPAHQKWNIHLRSNNCSLSTDELHISWTKGHDEAAASPRVTKITIVSETVPRTVSIEASNPASGVTCKCVKQCTLTAQEAKEHQEKQIQYEVEEKEDRRKKEEERRRAQARRQPTVESDSDSDCCSLATKHTIFSYK
ncbi:hypothetical protein C0992_009889 [Termitomyces sp. T32_za158]|nr:hypothetical protein C0992_009889 [Termitomyces sp. T32_za158]